MDHYDLRTLRILEEIDNDHSPSQRELARSLNISLGLVNSFVKRLAHKGYFKITTIPKNRVRYILTPKGAAEKTRLTYEYIQYSYKFYTRAREQLRELFKNLMAQGINRIVFYGVGDFAEIAYFSLHETTIKMVAVVDDAKIGEKFLGYLVSDPDVLGSFSFDRILVTAMRSWDEVFEKLLEKDISRDNIIMLQ